MQTLYYPRMKGLHFLECSVILCSWWWWIPARNMAIMLQCCQFVSARTTVIVCLCFCGFARTRSGLPEERPVWSHLLVCGLWVLKHSSVSTWATPLPACILCSLMVNKPVSRGRQHTPSFQPAFIERILVIVPCLRPSYKSANVNVPQATQSINNQRQTIPNKILMHRLIYLLSSFGAVSV